MDKFDFYKELFDEYTFDKEKIYKNAKQGKLAGKKRFPIAYAAIPAAAAVAVVTAGTLLFTHFGKPGDVLPPLPGGSLAALTDKERLEKFKEDIIKNEGSKELYNVIVTFTRALTPAETQTVLLAHSENSVPVKILYLEDGTRVSGSEEVGAVFRGGSGRISGAVIKCAGYLMAQLQNDGRVLAVEVLSDGDIDIIAPIKPDEDSVSVSDPVFSTGTESRPVVIVPPDDPGTSVPPDPVDPPANEKYDLDNSILEADGGMEPVFSEGSVSAAIPDSIAQRLPEGVVLPADIEKLLYITDNIGAQRAYFLNDSVFYVKTADDIRLYEFSDGAASLACGPVICPEAKVFWISENGSVLMAAGSDGEVYRVDANSREIRALNIKALTGEGVIVEIAYNENSGLLVMDILENGEYSLRTVSLASDTAQAETLYSAYDKFTLLAADGNVVYFATYSGTSLNVYRAAPEDGARLIASADGKYAVSRSAAFTHAVLNGERSYIFDPATESLIALTSNEAVEFGISAHGLKCGGEYYIIDSGALIPSGGISIMSQIDLKSSLSKYYAAFTENGAVRIAASSYTEKAMNEYLTFDPAAENAFDEVRGAVNAALAMQNVLAGNRLSECGIDDNEKLASALAVCFTENAGKELLSRYEGGESAGDICAIDIADTILAVSEEADGAVSGTLYVKAGSFCGRTAYYSCAVRLLSEGGVLRADCVIE